jgi:hypothetical protein
MRRVVIALALALNVAAPAAVCAEPEHTQERPVGFHPSFWMPNSDGAYQYRLVAIGAAAAAAMGFVMWRLIKRANSDRARMKR